MKTLLIATIALFAFACNDKPANSSYHNSSTCNHNEANCANKNTNTDINFNFSNANTVNKK